MPRAFLIKKHSPVRDPVSAKLRTTIEENESSRNTAPSSTKDQHMSDGRGPYDLSVKTRKFDLGVEAQPSLLPLKYPPTVIEFSPKIVTVSTPAIGVALIDRRTPSPHTFMKSGAPLEPLNPNTPPNVRTPPWHRTFVPPTYSPFRFPLYPLPRHATDFYTTPSPYLASSLVSPQLMTMSPQPALAMGFEKFTTCIPRENVSPTPSYYNGPSHPDSMLPEYPMSRHEYPIHNSPWTMHKEDSTSPIPHSDSSDSGRESAHKNVGQVTSSTNALSVGQIPRYQCVDCSKSYSTYSGLSRHRQFHCVTQAKKSFNCKYCDKIYVSLGALKMHIRTHTLPCKCKLCGKAFSRPWLLQGHIRTHTGEKPFACSHCNRAFADRSNLRAHLQTHSDVKKYSCKVCSKTFSRMSLLLKHNDGCCVASQPR